MLFTACTFSTLFTTNIELPFVVIIPSYNNAERYHLTLDSVFSQQYENYRVIYIDDCSLDGTAELVEQYIQENNLENKTTLIKNPQRYRKLKNIYNAIHSCADHEIIVLVDGDDWLAHDQVLVNLNKIYSTSDTWLTYGQYRNEPKEEVQKWGYTEMGYCSPVPQCIIENRQFRKIEWVFMHLRTFYAWLFKLIKLEDLIAETVPGFEGQFYPASNDHAVMHPMVEMAHHHFIFNSDVCYIRNLYSPLVGFKIDKNIQDRGREEIIAKPPYKAIAKPITGTMHSLNHATADLFIISLTPSMLTKCLSSITTFTSGINAIHVFYEKNSDSNSLYKQIAATFPLVQFIEYPSEIDETKRKDFIQYITQTSSDYSILAHDALLLQGEIDSTACIKLLEQTGAYGFYLALDCDSPLLTRKNLDSETTYQNIYDDIYAYKFCYGSRSWENHNNNMNMTLYRKQDILTHLEPLFYTSLSQLEDTFMRTYVDQRKVGLFFEQTKVKSFISRCIY